MIRLITYLVVSLDEHHIQQGKGTHPITYGPILPPMSAMKAFRIPASLYIAILSGDGPFGPPAPGGGPCTFIVVGTNERSDKSR
jgi:hypothetical protein